MMKMAFKSLLSCRFLPHSSAAVSSYCVTRVDSHFHLFSTITNHNPKPKPPFIASSPRPHAQLQQLLYDKSKIGFDNLDDALFVFHKMLNMKPPLSVMKFNQLLVALVRMQKYSVAVSMFRELRVLCIPVNIVTFNTIIKCCCCHLNNTLDHAFSLLGGMIKSGLVPNVVTYTTLIKGLLSQDRPVDAEHLFKKLLTFNEVQPNVVTYSIVIDGLCKTSNGYCKRQKVDKAIDLRRQMPEGLKPGVETYNTIIHGLFQMGRHGEARNLFNELLSNGDKPDIITCRILLDGFCKNQQIDEAISFFGLMECNGIIHDIQIYNILIDGLCKNRKLDEARHIFNNLVSRGLQPDVVTHNILIRGLCQEGLFEEAKELLSKMEVSSCLPNDVTYNTIIHGSLVNKKYKEALVLIETMRTRRFSADASTTSMVIDLLSTEEQDQSVLAFRKWFLQ